MSGIDRFGQPSQWYQELITEQTKTGDNKDTSRPSSSEATKATAKHSGAPHDLPLGAGVLASSDLPTHAKISESARLFVKNIPKPALDTDFVLAPLPHYGSPPQEEHSPIKNNKKQKIKNFFKKGSTEVRQVAKNISSGFKSTFLKKNTATPGLTAAEAYNSPEAKRLAGHDAMVGLRKAADNKQTIMTKLATKDQSEITYLLENRNLRTEADDNIKGALRALTTGLKGIANFQDAKRYTGMSEKALEFAKEAQAILDIQIGADKHVEVWTHEAKRMLDRGAISAEQMVPLESDANRSMVPLLLSQLGTQGLAKEHIDDELSQTVNYALDRATNLLNRIDEYKNTHNDLEY